MPLTEQQFERYARHITLPEIGVEGQARLLHSRVAVIGAGGLGSPALLYLAAAGVGHIDIIDPDKASLSNLQRQVIHREADLGAPKTESARRALHALNPDVNIETHAVYLGEDNAIELLTPADAVLDGCDNFATRLLVNDACFFLKKPLLFGAVSRFEGQAATFFPGGGRGGCGGRSGAKHEGGEGGKDGSDDSPCYRCLFPEPPPPELARPCREVGVLGVLPGLIGMIQATECLKIVLGIGETLAGRLLIYDALRMTFRTIRVQRDPACALCGEHPSITRLQRTGVDFPPCERTAPPFA